MILGNVSCRRPLRRWAGPQGRWTQGVTYSILYLEQRTIKYCHKNPSFAGSSPDITPIVYPYPWVFYHHYYWYLAGAAMASCVSVLVAPSQRVFALSPPSVPCQSAHRAPYRWLLVSLLWLSLSPLPCCWCSHYLAVAHLRATSVVPNVSHAVLIGGST